MTSGTAYGAERGVLAIAHRGGGAMGPENTMDAFEAAVALGYTHLETDVRRTADGVCVAFHDRSLRRVTGAAGNLSDLSWDDVTRLRVSGSGQGGGTGAVPRIEELLTTWPGVRWALDVKQPSAIPALVRAVRAANAEHRVCLSGTWDRWLIAAHHALGPASSLALGWRSMTSLVAGHRLRLSGHRYVHLPLTVAGRPLTWPRIVERAHAHGLRLIVWGLVRSADMHRLLDHGVDGIPSDHTDVLREVLVARGEWHPAAAPPRTCVSPST
jgi:glycerophosphoryl diester phosphodiesterase